MSGGQVRKVLREDIQLVQNLIERCLQLYMTRKQTVSTLLRQAKIDPSFTVLVWQRLEDQNPEFFRIYYTRLLVKDQIMRFNALLEIQIKSMPMYATGSIPVSDGSQIQPEHAEPNVNSTFQATEHAEPNVNSTFQATEHAEPNVKLANMHQTIDGNLPHVYTTGAPSVQSYEQAAVDVSAHARSTDISPDMLLPQSANLGMMPGPNGGIGEDILLQAGAGIGNPSLPHFSNVESSVKKEDPWGADTSSFGFLGQIPRNFSFSDLTADFPDDEILRGYSGPGFLPTDTNDFLDPLVKGEQEHEEDTDELDTISEDMSFDDLASD